MKTYLLDILLRIGLLTPIKYYCGIKHPHVREPDYANFDFDRAYDFWKDMSVGKDARAKYGKGNGRKITVIIKKMFFSVKDEEDC